TWILLPTVFITPTITSFSAALAPSDFERRVIVYRYRPSVFADQKLHIGITDESKTLQGILWYIQPQESDAALLGMDVLARLLVERQVPGLDLSRCSRVTSNDIDRLLVFDVWSQLPLPYRFRLLKLAGTMADDRAMGAVGRMSQLEALSLGVKITDAG